MLVVDASAVVRGCIARGDVLPGDLVSPPILWSEVPSALHELRWRKAASRELTDAALEKFLGSGIEKRDPPDLIITAWEVADRLGWAKTYDAEYVALALLLECRLLTIDARLRRGAARAVEVIGPSDL